MVNSYEVADLRTELFVKCRSHELGNIEVVFLFYLKSCLRKNSTDHETQKNCMDIRHHRYSLPRLLLLGKIAGRKLGRRVRRDLIKSRNRQNQQKQKNVTKQSRDQAACTSHETGGMKNWQPTFTSWRSTTKRRWDSKCRTVRKVLDYVAYSHCDSKELSCTLIYVQVLPVLGYKIVCLLYSWLRYFC